MAKRRRIATDEELFLLRREGVSYRDIANYFGISVDSVRGRVSRFRSRIKRSIPSPVQKVLRPVQSTPNVSDIQDTIEQDDVAQHIGIDDAWINEHIHFDGMPSGLDFKYVSMGFKHFDTIEKRVIGSGIEDFMYIWYDDNQGLWFYGVEEIS